MNDEQIIASLLSIERELSLKGDYAVARKLCNLADQLRARRRPAECGLLYLDRRAREVNEYNDKMRRYDELEQMQQEMQQNEEYPFYSSGQMFF